MKFRSYFLIIAFLMTAYLPISRAQESGTNVLEGCVQSYDPDVDYFPAKAKIEYAEGLTIDYFNNYKVITVSNAWRGADVSFQYVLVQCGTPAPEGYDDAVMIEVPVKTYITMSTTEIPYLDEMELLDGLVALDSFSFVHNPNVHAMIDEGKLAEIGYGSTVNVEIVLDRDPDLVFAQSSGTPEYDSHPVLLAAGIPTVLIGDWTETSPLGRSEWVNFIAAFFNQEAKAADIFAGIVTRYQDMVALAANVEHRPTVLTDVPYEGTWYVPGGRSYLAAMLKDAGADYLWADDEGVGSVPLDFESVIGRAVEADFWINVGYWNTLNDGLAQDERFAEFVAFQNGNVYNNNVRVNEMGGNDIYETGVSNPELILADFIAIFHPELLPDHDFFFYQKLQ